MKENELTFPDWLSAPLRALTALGDRLPHALLVHGPPGVGKRTLARALARATLCESTDAARRRAGGCGACPACAWFDRGNHPDYRRVTTEVVALAEGSGDEDLEDDDREADVQRDASRAKKAPSREIKVEQIRALQRFLAVGTHRARARVVVLYPLESLNAVGANALLKMLEEPPAATVFVLVADHPGRIAATIVSRCRKVPVALPTHAEALAWLTAARVADADHVLALAGGAPFAARDLASDGTALDAHRTLVGFLARPDVEGALATAEGFARSSPAPLVRWVQLWLADCIAARLARRVRYHPERARGIAALARAASVDALFALMRRVTAIVRTVEHPLNTRLMLEALLLEYVAAIAPA